MWELRFGIDLNSFEITNYDQLKNVESINQFSGVVLDESSILKGRDGKLSSLIIQTFKQTPYNNHKSFVEEKNSVLTLF